MADDIQVPPDLRERVRDLPVLPAAVVRLFTLTQQAEVSVAEIARVIDSDPALMARTLRVATHHDASAPHTLGGIVGTANDLIKTIQLGFGGNRFIAAVLGGPTI